MSECVASLPQMLHLQYAQKQHKYCCESTNQYSTVAIILKL